MRATHIVWRQAGVFPPQFATLCGLVGTDNDYHDINSGNVTCLRCSKLVKLPFSPRRKRKLLALLLTDVVIDGDHVCACADDAIIGTCTACGKIGCGADRRGTPCRLTGRQPSEA